MPLAVLAIPFRIALTRVMPIAEEGKAHRRLGSPNWRAASEEHAG
jgi:hypothetical protein